MKCIACNNELPKTGGWASEKNPKGKLACMLPGCPTHGIKTGSKRFQIEVMGKTQEQVDADWKKRLAKGVETKREAGFYEDKSNNPYSLEFWLKKGLTVQEAENKLKQKTDKAVASKRAAGFYDDKANNPYSIEFYEKQGFSREESELIIRQKNHNCAEYWLKRGYSLDDAKVLASNSAGTNSLSEKQKRYGEVEGFKRYLQTKEQMSVSWNPRSSSGRSFSSSQQADILFKKLYKFVRRLGYTRHHVMCNLNAGELWLRDATGIFFYDFCLKPLKLIIEFNGEHVHPRKEKLTLEEWNSWKHAYSKQSAEEVFCYEQKKLARARQVGYNILTLWSKDAENFDLAVQFILKAHHGNQSHEALSEPVSSSACGVPVK